MESNLHPDSTPQHAMTAKAMVERWRAKVGTIPYLIGDDERAVLREKCPGMDDEAFGGVVDVLEAIVERLRAAPQAETRSAPGLSTALLAWAETREVEERADPAAFDDAKRARTMLLRQSAAALAACSSSGSGDRLPW